MTHQIYYTDLAEAAEVIRSRQYLRRAVEDYWLAQNAQFPDWLAQSKPSALWARQMITWRFEDMLFADMANRAKLPTIWMQLLSDQFTEVSTLKRSYAHPFIATGISKQGKVISHRSRLIEMRDWKNKPLSEIVTQDGQKLSMWHKARWQRGYGLGTIVDTDAVKFNWGNTVQRHYLGLMSMCIAHGVLFEDYHGGESGKKLGSFTDMVFEPAFAAVSEYFGMQPLIVKMPWWPELALYPSDEWMSRAIIQSVPQAA